MRITRSILFTVLAASLALPSCRSSSLPTGLKAPVTRKVDQTDVYHGRVVADPYRWLEDDHAPETEQWVERQNAHTFGYLETLPTRDEIRRRLTELWNYERLSLPVERGGKTFYRRNDGLQDHAVLYVQEGDGEPRVLLDPNTLSEDGTVALVSFVPSPDGSLVALGTSDGGSDWRRWSVIETATGRAYPELVTGNKFGGIEWARNGDGYFYLRFDRPSEGGELSERSSRPDVYFHALGTLEERDSLVVSRPENDKHSIWFELTSDRDGVIVSVNEIGSHKNALDLIKLPRTGPVTAGFLRDQPPGRSRIHLVKDFDAAFDYVGSLGHRHWVVTDLDAPRRRVLEIDERQPQRASWKELVPEAQDSIQTARVVGGRIFVSYLRDARSVVRVFDDRGEHVRDLALPGIGSVRGFDGEWEDERTYFSFTSYTRPTSIYRHEIAAGKTTLFQEPELDCDTGAFESKQVFYTSKDGTRVPMFLTYKRGLKLDGRNRTYLYGYGGFNVSLTPRFSVPNLVWMERGGVLAVPNLRGGGEYGEAWHQAGTKLQKQNVFDDFIAAAEWLFENGYTRPDKLAIGGGSNGGLLVGACLTQRPELFGAALPAVGVLDMLRYHEFTIGWAWAGDYGTVDDPAEFEALLAYSPLHNVKPGTSYPATLITTADHDDRVVPAHSFKFAATLQEAQAGDAPVLIRIETRAGHGAGKPTTMRIEEAADRWAFVEAAL